MSAITSDWTSIETETRATRGVESSRVHRREEEFRAALNSYMAGYIADQQKRPTEAVGSVVGIWRRLLTAMSSMVKSTPPSCAAARMCSTVLVEPPMAISSVMAFSNASLGRDAARQHRASSCLVIALGDVDDQAPGFDEQLLAIGMGRHQRTVAGQRQARAPRSGSSSSWR